MSYSSGIGVIYKCTPSNHPNSQKRSLHYLREERINIPPSLIRRFRMAGEMSERIAVDGFRSAARLSNSGEIRWRRDGESLERSLNVEMEVLGLSLEGRDICVRAFVNEEKGFFCRKSAGFGKKLRKDFLLEMPTEEAAERWSDRIRDCLNSLGRPKRLFIIVNPYGGKKCAQKIFRTEIKPLLVAANIMYTLQETKYQLHAQEIAHKLDLLKYDGIVCVSGDGVLVEVLNGLLKREDWDTAIRVPLGIIPAGTGNGLAKSLLDSVGDFYSIEHATFAIVRGHKRSLDVATISQGEKKFFSILMLTWGLIADVDIESEKYRWLGSTRLDFYGFLRIMNLRKYHGRVDFVPAPGHEFYGEQMEDIGSCVASMNTSKAQQNNSAEVLQGGYQGPTDCYDHSDWRSFEGPFISVSLFNVPWVGEDTKPAPEAKFSDGYLDLAILKDCSKASIVSLLTKMSDGSHVKCPYVTYLKVKAIRLVPGNRVDEPTKGGIIDVDGEVIARGEGTYMHGKEADLMAYGSPIQMIVDKGLATIFTPR